MDYRTIEIADGREITVRVGDRIQFRAVTRFGAPKVWRKVNGFWGDTDQPTVRNNGWDKFAVRLHEIADHEKSCGTPGCNNNVDDYDDDLCHGCEADNSHRAFWGSGIPMSHHAPA